MKPVKSRSLSNMGRSESVSLKIFVALICFMFISTIPAGTNEQELPVRMTASSPFGTPVLVNKDKAGEQTNPVLQRVPGHGLFVAWQDSRMSDGIYSSRSNNGSIFTPGVRVDDPMFNTSIPRGVAATVSNNGTLYLVWEDNRRNTFDYDIFLAKSLNLGGSFSKNVKADDSNYTRPSWQEQASVAVTLSGTVYVAWTDSRTGIPRLRGASSNDFGHTFIASRELFSGSSNQNQVELAANGNRIFAAFIDNPTGVNHPYVSVSPNGGRTFSTPVRLDDTGSPGKSQQGVSIAPMPNGGIVAVWEDSRNGASDVYAVFVSADGVVISSNIRVDNDAGLEFEWQDNPCVAADQLGNVYVAWQDERTTGSPAIRFALLRSGASTFNASVVIDTPQISGGVPAMQMNPSIVAESPGRVYVTWQDDKSGTADIYVAQGIFPNLYNLALGRGWNFISLFLDGKTYKASTLGLRKGDMIAGWNSAKGAYDQRYIVGVSPASADFSLSNSTGYWVYAIDPLTLVFNGTVPTTKHVRAIIVPSGGFWVSIGFESLNSTRKASDIPGMFSIPKGITSVVGYNPTTNRYSTYVVGVPPTDFRIVPGQGYWAWCQSSGVLAYDS